MSIPPHWPRALCHTTLHWRESRNNSTQKSELGIGFKSQGQYTGWALLEHHHRYIPPADIGKSPHSQVGPFRPEFQKGSAWWYGEGRDPPDLTKDTWRTKAPSTASPSDETTTIIVNNIVVCYEKRNVFDEIYCVYLLSYFGVVSVIRKTVRGIRHEINPSRWRGTRVHFRPLGLLVSPLGRRVRTYLNGNRVEIRVTIDKDER